MDEALLDALLPLRRAWANGRCDPPEIYSSSAVFERTLSELFLCQSLCIGFWRRPNNAVAQCDRSLFTLPAVRHCRWLVIDSFPQAIDVEDVVDWLHSESAWDEPKYMDLGEGLILLGELVPALKTVSTHLGKKVRNRKSSTSELK